MKTKLQITLGMILLVNSAIGQTTDLELNKSKQEKPIPRTYLLPIINLASSNINYGSSNSNFSDFKKDLKGIQAGVSVQAGLAPNFSLLSELYYMRKGGTLKVNNPLTADETSYRFNTLEIPVMARVHIGKIHLNGGPSLAYNMSGKEKTENQSRKMTFGGTGEDLKRFEAGIGAGGGFRFHVKQKVFVFDLRYNHGLTNISTNKEMYNRSIVVSLIGFKLPK